ncbi:MAG TPA: phytanoyl-CoA dioxygenase family protein [Planctomycetota bacterium]|nr:phytanoyl-CoA dioxygenase family protein [Planctomycetota bacterium]
MSGGADPRATLARDGVVRVRRPLARATVVGLVRAFPGAGSRRHLLAEPAVRRLIADPAVRALVTRVLGRRAAAVRGLLIDKREGADWALPFHQDRVVAVVARRDTDGFSGWSLKDGVVHALAPGAVLRRMIAVRVHLDACDAGSGALRVLPGSHRHGVLDDDATRRLASTTAEHVLAAGVGDVVLMRPLLLHASARSGRVGPRRVVHIDFAAGELPGGLRWRACVC